MMEGFLLVLGLICAAIVGGVGYLLFSAARTMGRGPWQEEAEAVIARTQAAFTDLRRTIAESDRSLQRSLSSAVREAERLLKRQEELKRMGLTVTRGLQNKAFLRAQREVQRLRALEQRANDPRLRAEYTKSRELLERQIAHYGALRDKLLQILENMREIQGVVEAMQPRVIRLALHDATVQAPSTVMDGVKPSVLEELDIYIDELEKMDAMSELLDINAIERDIEAETQRRLQTGELSVDPALLGGHELKQK